MENNTIISLCYVGNKNDKTTELCRFADYIDGRFVPYAYDYNRDFYGEERDLIIGMSYDVLADVGEIGVFEWFSYMNSANQWRTNVKRNNEISWCEVLYLERVESPAMMIQMLKNGFQCENPFDGKHDLVLVSRKDLSGFNAVMLRKGMLKVRDNIVCLNDNVLKVPIGTVDLRSATGSCQCRRSKNDTRRFLRGQDGFVTKKNYPVKEPVEVVRDIIQGNIGYFDSEVLTRKEKQLLRSVLARVTEPTIIDMVCDRLDCTVEEAHEYINQFIETAKTKLDRQTALSIIEKLVESDVDAVMEMKRVVQEEWLSEHETLVAEKKKEIEHYTEELKSAKETAESEKTRVQQAVQSEEGKRKRLAQENDELTDSVANLKQLKEDLEKEIQERLSKAKEDLAGSMLDHALMMPIVPVQQPVISETKAPKAFSVSFQSEETETTSVYDCHDVAQTSWNRVCGDKDMASGLALLALAAFACNCSMIVAGEGSESIADLLSVCVCGHMPLKLHIHNDADIEALAEEVESQNHQIICVINGLESGYAIARDLMERFRDSRFIFTAMHGESLVMEPESLFTTFFPVLTDYFYNGRHVLELPTLDCSEELLVMENSEQEKQAFKEAKRIVGKWLKDEFFPPLLKIRCARLIASMIILAKELDLSDSELHNAELELVLTPWLKCLRKTELLQRLLEDDGVLDAYKKKDLISYIGMGGM